MKAASFDYVRADSVDACVRALAQAHGDGKILAGGQSLVPVLAMRLARPAVIVDVNRIPGLSRLDRHDDVLSVGSLVRHAQLVDQTHSPLLAEAARWIGHPAIRSRGTIGGSLAHADPSAEWPVVAAALDATIRVAGPSGSRAVAAVDFFLGPLEPALNGEEIVVGVDLPIPERWGFAELSRRHGDFGLVIVVTALVAGEWRIAVGGVGGVPLRMGEAEAILAADTDSARLAAQAAAAACDPSDDVHAPKEYRRAMVEEFTFRAITRALSKPAEGARR